MQPITTKQRLQDIMFRTILIQAVILESTLSTHSVTKGGLPLYVRLQGSTDTVAVDLPPAATVAELRTVARFRYGIFTYGGQELRHSEALADAGVSAESVIDFQPSWTIESLNDEKPFVWVKLREHQKPESEAILLALRWCTSPEDPFSGERQVELSLGPSEETEPEWQLRWSEQSDEVRFRDITRIGFTDIVGLHMSWRDLTDEFPFGEPLHSAIDYEADWTVTIDGVIPESRQN